MSQKRSRRAARRKAARSLRERYPGSWERSPPADAAAPERDRRRWRTRRSLSQDPDTEDFYDGEE